MKSDSLVNKTLNPLASIPARVGIWRLYLICSLLTTISVGQNNTDYEYFEMDHFAMVSNYYYDNSVLVIDFYVYHSSLKFSKYTKQRIFVLPENQNLINLPSKWKLWFQRIFKSGKQYSIKLKCPRHKVYISDIIAKVYLEEYDVWVVNDERMAWHVCELVSVENVE